MSNRFFTSQPLIPGEIELDGDDAHHLSTVRRFEPDDAVVLFNGDGADYPATVLSATKRSVRLRIDRRVDVSRESVRSVTIAAALPKGDRFDFLIEKLVELGVSTFVPLTTVRSVVVPSETKRAKWERAVIEASKQCGRNRLMTIGSPVEWSKWLAVETGLRFVLHTDHHPAFPRLETTEPVTIAIGPEGGFTDDELHDASAAGWTIASLGSRVLRIETAALAAATLAIPS